MSEENVEKVRRAIEEFGAGVERGEPGAFFDLEFMADDYEWVVAQAFEGREVWTGREEFVEFVRTWTEEFDDWSFQTVRLIDATMSESWGFCTSRRPERRVASRSTGRWVRSTS
jgi:hypothetical protein